MRTERIVPSSGEWNSQAPSSSPVLASAQCGGIVILPKDRDSRFITIRRGGTLTDSDHRLLASWAATCAEHVLHLFESVQPSDPRPREAIEQIRAWASGEIRMSQSRAAGGHAMAAARELSGAARHAAYAAGQAAVVAHVAAHELGAAAYAIKAARAAAPGSEERAGRLECPRQDSNLCFRLRRPTLYPLSYGGDPNPSLATGFLGPVAGQRSSASILRSWSPRSLAYCWLTTTP